MSGKEHLYSSRQTATIFSVALETIRNWAEEFQDYLSPTANPGRGKRRMYSDEDLQVFSLVSELKKQGMTYPDIHISLQNGQRGQSPALPPDEVQNLVVGGQERRLELGVEYLQRSIIQLQHQLEVAQEEVTELKQVETENIKLTILLEERERQVGELKTQLDEVQEENKRLLRESGQEYAKGMLDAFERRESLSDKDDD